MTPGEYVRQKSSALAALEREVIALGMKCVVIVYDDASACQASMSIDRERIGHVLLSAALRTVDPPSGKMEIDL